MIEEICFIVAASQYATFHHFTNQFAAAFRRQGVEVKVINILETKISKEDIFLQLVRRPPTLTCSFGVVYLIKPHYFIFDDLHIPHWTITVDPSTYFSYVVKAPSALFSAVDRNECDLLRMQNERVFFLPHGVDQELLQPLSKQEERYYDAVFIGSCYDYMTLQEQWCKELPCEQSQMLEMAIELFFSHGSLTLMEAFIEAFNTSGIQVTGLELKMLVYFDHYVRGRTRVEMLQNLPWLRIHVFGDIYPTHLACSRGWQAYLGGLKNIVVHPAIAFEEIAEILRHSKFCLNSMPFFQDGSHERVLMALACGSLPITSPSRWLEEQFTVGKELFIYTPATSSTLEEELSLILNDEESRQRYAAEGQANIARSHTWDQRAVRALASLPPLLQQIKMNFKEM